MNAAQQSCQDDLERNQLIPRKYYGQVFTTDPVAIETLIQAIQSVYRPKTKVVEIGGGLGYITEKLANHFDDLDVLEIDEELVKILKARFANRANINILQQDILEYPVPQKDYLLVGNIPFHVSGKLYRRFMSDEAHKPYGMVFITDKQYARTLMGQPPRCYRVSLQAQAYGDIEIVADVPPTSVYPEVKVMSCIMKIVENDITLPKNFWKVVNHHWEHFPTPEVESPKTMGLERWIELAKKTNHKID
ncbi:methyltransferase domain-containing protein [Candidatus Peregrinibacteria bacterium]|nr:MAG: methyltransferase domain-containing protein [Candidatus Peregrinibacteria bacterium]